MRKLSVLMLLVCLAAMGRSQRSIPFATGATMSAGIAGIPVPVGTPVCTHVSSGSTIPLTYTAVAAGNTAILSILTEPATSVTSSITDSASSSYTHPTSANAGSAVAGDMWGALSLNSGATNPVVTLNGATTNAIACIQEFSGVKHFGATSIASPTGTTYSDSLTTTGTNSIVLLGEGSGNSSSWTCTTGTQAIYYNPGGSSEAVQYNSATISGTSVTIAGTGPAATLRSELLELKSQ